jgi:hypothetical protein
MVWTETYDAVFFISAGTIFVGLLKYAIDNCLKSKCEEFSLCGILKIKRRVDLEVQEEIRALELKAESVSDRDSEKISNQEIKREEKKEEKKEDV